MTGPIVCGVDFSDDSKHALRWAHLVAERFSQPLMVVHAIEPLLAAAAELASGSDTLYTNLDAELRTFVAAALGPAARARIEIGTGKASGIIRGTALAASAGLIVAGTQGLGEAGRLWFGSTTTNLLRETTLPILAVAPGAAARSDGPLRVTHVIVGTDFGEASRAAFDAAAAFGQVFDAPVTALHAIPALPVPARWIPAAGEAMDVLLRDARARMATSVPDHWSSEVRSGNPARVLVEAATKREALIVVGVGGAALGQRPGTTAYRVLCEADAPVLAVPVR
jgi:nucleotide-binding universal stress UspA family protein